MISQGILKTFLREKSYKRPLIWNKLWNMSANHSIRVDTISDVTGHFKNLFVGKSFKILLVWNKLWHITVIFGDLSLHSLNRVHLLFLVQSKISTIFLINISAQISMEIFILTKLFNLTSFSIMSVCKHSETLLTHLNHS